MGTNRKLGLTLVEVVVLLAGLALVAALVMPHLRRAMAVQRRVACASNLSKLGQACAVRRWGDRALDPPSWPRWIKSQVARDSRVFLCPEDREPAPPGAPPLSLRWQCKCTHWIAWRLQLAEGGERWVFKMSRTQWKTFAATYVPGKPYAHPGYVEDDDPSTYLYAIAAEPCTTWPRDCPDDAELFTGEGRDYRDQMFMIRERATGVKIYPIRGGASPALRLYADLDEGGPRLILPDLYKYDGERAITIPYDCWPTSFGMNSVADRILHGAPKVLLLDYERALARGSDREPAELDDWTAERLNDPGQHRPGGPPTFARHFGGINVLYGTGAVRVRSTEALDPLLSADNRQTQWNP